LRWRNNIKNNINIVLGENMKKLFLAVSIAAFSFNPGFGAFSKNDAGTSAAQFLKLGAGARVTAMGGASAGLSGDSTDIYWNPAGLNQITGKGSLSAMNASWFEDISYDWVSFAMPYKNWGVFGIGAQYLSYGSIKQIDDTGLETGDFSPADLCVSLSYARKYKGIDFGANVKYVLLKILDSASAYAVDLGAQYKVKNALNNKLTLGLVAQNIGTQIKFINEADPLPFNIKLGGAYEIKSNWLAVLDVNAPIDDMVNVGAGTEYCYKVKEEIGLIGRAGYNTQNSQTGGLNGVSAGIGIKYTDYCLDYAFVPYGELGNTQRISLAIKF
jgi:hypothetical protein